MKILICIATYKRPKLLAGLLSGLAGLQFKQVPVPDVSIVVVDNDSSESAREVCAQMTRWPLTYSVEKRRGISKARNRALAEVKDNDAIIFIDDDETPDPDWLEALLLAQQQYGADVVSGPVIPTFTPAVPSWIRQSTFFDCYDYKTGRLLEHCATNNTLVLRRVLQQVSQFDERFDFSGAEDLHFFSRVHMAGYKMVWTREARVSEQIAPDRANFGWLLRRSWRAGNCAVAVELALDNRFTVRVKRFGKACLRMFQGVLEMFPALYRGQAQAVHSLRRVCLGLGMLAGLFGHTYQPYRVTTGE